jgi:hypothetical protein
MLNVKHRYHRIFSFDDIINFDKYLIHFDIVNKLHFFVELMIELIHNQFEVDYTWYSDHYEELKYVYIHCNRIRILHVDEWIIQVIDRIQNEGFHIVLD